jgi:two-component system chemotaxis sensor kinase CheA
VTYDDAELLKAFITESESNMAEFQRWLHRPFGTADDLANAFRWMHTLAGSCGFFGFVHLRKIARAAENCLGALRDRGGVPDPALLALLGRAATDIRRFLAVIAAAGREPDAPSPVQADLERWTKGARP